MKTEFSKGRLGNWGINYGLDKERKHTVDVNTYVLYGPVSVDIFYQPKYMLTLMYEWNSFNTAGNSLSWSLMPLSVFKSICWTLCCSEYLRKVKWVPLLLAAHEEWLESWNVLYPIQKHELITFTIPRGMLTQSKDNPFQRLIPKLLIFELVSSEDFSSGYIKNPFLFHHYDLNYLFLTLDGDNIPHQPFTPDWRL